ncbi:MAG: TonB-dependent receptor plug domain-containing protein, partial [Dissulfurimicrobium sp.]|uniref:TonB-dependent receptor plug domain-containing protein n=1 Tax=Dissulfurimicrobium sp. TaxID=2022436 RepID=UPI003D09D89B
MERAKILAHIFLGMFFLASGGMAGIALGEGPDDAVSLEDVLVTATRTEQSLSSAPGSAYVVTKDEMSKRDIQSIDQAVNTLPGVYSSRGKGILDSIAAVSMRGISGQQRNLVMLNGVILNDAYSGGVPWGAYSPEDIDRIEVVEGPFSSLYGGYAMGGVINLITKLPQKREFKLKTGYGSSWDRGNALDDLRTDYVSYGDRYKDRFSLFLSYGFKTTEGYPAGLDLQGSRPPAGVTGYRSSKTPKGEPRYLIGDTGDNRWWNDSLTLRGGYDISQDSAIEFMFMRARYEYNYDYPHTYLRDGKGDPVWSYGKVREASYLLGPGGKEQDIYNISYKTRFGSLQTKLNLGISELDDSWYTMADSSSATRFGGPGKVSNTPSKNYSGDLQFTLPVMDSHILTFGSSFRQGRADTREHTLSDWQVEDEKGAISYQSKGKDRIFALFVQDEYIILDNLTLFIGARQDWWKTYDGYINQIGSKGYPIDCSSNTDSAFSPKLAIVYNPFKEMTLKTSVGQAFRPPTVYELYRTWTAVSGITYAGNPNLKPEKTTSWDAGIEQGLWKGAKIKAVYFENYLKDLIYRKIVTDKYQELINAGRAESKGIELELEQKLYNSLKLFANFTYID